MAKKTIEVPPLTAKMICNLVLKWLEEPEHKEWLEKNISSEGEHNGNDE